MRMSWPMVNRRHAITHATYADVVELVDTLALGASASGREGSSPFIRTKLKSKSAGLLFNLILSRFIICQGPSSAVITRKL
ncbi:MAG: hypothetical protein JWN26_511 [Candidatus Saccharibacteria bacterium]|nr:hypothetical protein [Candidatus Saccharibacteria bacterium]